MQLHTLQLETEKITVKASFNGILSLHQIFQNSFDKQWFGFCNFFDSPESITVTVTQKCKYCAPFTVISKHRHF